MEKPSSNGRLRSSSALGSPARRRRTGHVAGDEPDASLLQPEQEMGVATQPIDLGDQERRAGQPRMLHGAHQLRPIVRTLAELNFGEGGDELVPARRPLHQPVARL